MVQLGFRMGCDENPVTYLSTGRNVGLARTSDGQIFIPEEDDG